MENTLPPFDSSKLKTPILVTGAEGMLGWEFCQRLRTNLPEFSLVPMGRKELDITDGQAIEKVLAEIAPAVLINCAAYTSVDQAEEEREKALLINAEGPALLAAACAEHDTKMVHFGTDQVFDGSANTPRDESDSASPSNWYAETKWRGEQAVLEYPDNLSIRVQWLYGPKKDRFTILKNHDVFTPFDDQRGAPTHTEDIVNITLHLLSKGASGLFHLSYDDSATWFEIYRFVKEEMDLSVSLEPKKTQDVGLPANRPLYSVMSNKKLCQTLGWPGIGSWKPRMRAFLQEQSDLK